jgi:hypothetical protein
MVLCAVVSVLWTDGFQTIEMGPCGFISMVHPEKRKPLSVQRLVGGKRSRLAASGV